MSPRQWHSVLPSGAFSSSALAEDLAPALGLSTKFGQSHILLAKEDYGTAHFSRIEDGIRANALIPQKYVSLDEFAVSETIAQQISLGYHFAVIIDREPSAAAIERMASTLDQLAQITYVVIGRKDWRFKDTFRSLPHFVRPRLRVDFPLSIHHSDAFYSPAELSLILEELGGSSGFEAPVSFSPHFGLRREILRANVIAVSGPNALNGLAPEVSVIASDPEVLNRLAGAAGFSDISAKLEFVVSRVIGEEAKPIQPISAPVSHVWLHLEESRGPYPEMGAHLRNWGASHARGKTLVFADGETAEYLAEILTRLISRQEAPADLLSLGFGAVMETSRFLEAGGYDPLYYYFSLGDAELFHRCVGGLNPLGAYAKLGESLRARVPGTYRAIGAGLLFHQYFDREFYRYFSPSTSEAVEAEQEGNSRLRNQLRYRLEQSRDAYLGIYKASPRVALDGHIQILLKPYHWLKPYAWLLKMPVYPLIVQPYHLIKLHAWLLKMPVYPLIVKPYHLVIRPYAWLLKMPVYPLIVKPYHLLIRPYAWLLKMPVYPLIVRPYHFLRQYVWRFFRENIWKVKHVYYFAKVAGWKLFGLLLRLKGQLWRVKQVYYFIYRLLFPIRKVYYFAEYQFEKRILGLYGRQYVWIRK